MKIFFFPRSKVQQMLFGKLLLSIVALTLCCRHNVVGRSLFKTDRLHKSRNSLYTTNTGRIITAKNDSALILQKCLDLPALQPYFPKNADGTYKQVYVMHYPVSFSADLPVTKFNKKVKFQQIEHTHSAKKEAFLIVNKFSIAGDTAEVLFEYYFNFTTTPAIVEGSLTLERNGANWNITKSSTYQR